MKLSVRLRLTLSYAGFLIVAGVVLLAILFWLLHFIPAGGITDDGPYIPDRGDLLRVFWPRALEALAALSAIGLAGGWFVAGRMLRPLARISDVARQVALGRFDQRVRLTRRDEYGLLADTFDSMLDRIVAALAEQQRFAANASHELRTPLAISQAMIEVAIADPEGRDVDEILRRLRETTGRGGRIVESLLTMAAVDQSAETSEVVIDPSDLVTAVIDDLRAEAEDADVEVIVSLSAGGLIKGEPTLLRQLLSNLVVNAIRHNVPHGGWAEVVVFCDSAGAVELGVANTGPIVTPEVAATLTEPFVRGGGRIAFGHHGSGLGLAIAARICEVHDASLDVTALPQGGLDVRARFPPAGRR